MGDKGRCKMDIVKVFKENDTVFTTNGDYIISCHKALVHDELNGDFYLELEVSNENVRYLPQRSIVSVYYNGSWQGFRISYSETMENYTYFKAWHVFYDSNDFLIKDLIIDNETFSDAIVNITNGTTETCQFSISSSCTDNVNIEIHYNTLFEVINALITSHNLYLTRDNYSVSLSSTVGEKSQRTVEYGKNLSLMNEYCSIDNLVTKLYPTAIFNDTEYCIDSEYLEDNTLYGKIYTKHVEFDLENIEYYQLLLDEYNSLLKEIDDTENDNAKSINNIGNYQQELAEKIDEYNALISEVEYIKEKYRQMLTESYATRQEIYNMCIDALNKGISYNNKKLSSLNKKKTTYETKISYLESSIETNQDLYKTYITKKYKEKAKALKKTIDEQKKDLKSYKTKLSEVKKKITTYTTKKTKLQEQKTDDFASIDDITKYDITELFSLLKEYGLKISNNLIIDYCNADDTIDDKESMIDEINDKYEDIYEIEEEIYELNSKISIEQENSANYESKISTLTTDSQTVKNTLDEAIKEELEVLAQKHLDKYKYPMVSYEIDSIIQGVSVGDEIIVKNAKLGVDLDTKLNLIEYDCISERIVLLNFGNIGYSLQDLQVKADMEIADKIEKNRTLLESAYSNMMSKVGDIEGFVTGMLSEEVIDGVLTECMTQISLAKGRIEMKVSEDSVDKKISAQVTILSNQIESKVTQDQLTEAKQSVITQLSNEISSRVTYDDLNTTKESILTQTSDSISTKVDKDGVNSLIQQWYNAITITAEKINLNGYVNVNNGLIVNSDGTCKIGGWETDATRIYSSKTMGDGKVGYVLLNNDFYTAANGNPYNPVFGIMYDNDWKAYFRSNGQLYSKDAVITGSVTATSFTSQTDSYKIDMYEGFTITELTEYESTSYSIKGPNGCVSLLPSELAFYEGTNFNGTSGYITFIADIGFEISRPIYGTDGRFNRILSTSDADAKTIGLASNRWNYGYFNTVYNSSGVITTSDRNVKNSFTAFDDRYYNLASMIDLQLFKYNDGTSDRFHSGAVAQEVVEAMAECEISLDEYGLVCIDTWQDDNGNNYEMYNLRYDELNVLMNWYNRKKNDELQTKINNMQDQINQLKEVIESWQK